MSNYIRPLGSRLKFQFITACICDNITVLITKIPGARSHTSGINNMIKFSNMFLASGLVLLGVYLFPTIFHSVNQFMVPYFNDHPDYLATSCELATSRGYDCQEHLVTTDDGYVLKIQRVGNKTFRDVIEKPAALLMHGCECDSSVWVQNLQHQSLGYILADSGLDVWLGNVRGNLYGEGHISLNSDKDSEFWKFSFQEMVEFDIPAMVNYVKNVSKQDKIYYVGHSQGSLIALLRLSEYQSFMDDMKLVFLLSPVHALQDMLSPVKYILEFMYRYGQYLPDFRFGHRPPNSLAVWTHRYPMPTAYIIDYVWDAFSGDSDKTLNRNLTHSIAYYSHGLAGTSIRNVNHFAQIYKRQTLAKFDYGSEQENMKHYNSKEPPKYKLENIVASRQSGAQTSNETSNVTVKKLVMFWGDRDWLVTESDRKTLRKKVDGGLLYSKICENFSHLDFIWGIRASECSYSKINEMILQHEHS